MNTIKVTLPWVIIAFAIGLYAGHATRVGAQSEGPVPIRSCVKNSNGSIRIIDEQELCHGNETPLTWNVQGPAGHPDPAPYLATFTLSGAQLAYADFRYRDFAGLDMQNMDLSGALLAYSDFTQANLSGSGFVQADFRGAVLASADMSGANLTGATLDDTNIASVVFNGANLDNTSLVNATGAPIGAETAIYSDTRCPDGTNSDDHEGTCVGHFRP